jgi:hypothetical protein
VPEAWGSQKEMRRYSKLSRKLCKAVAPFAVKRWEKQKGKMNRYQGGLLLFLRDMDPGRMLAKFRD